MRTREEVLRILKEELPFLRNKFKVRKVGLFGSCARAEQVEGSDIDVLVEFEEPVGFFKFIELEDYLSRKLEARVELVTPDAIKPLIKPYIMREVIYV